MASKRRDFEADVETVARWLWETHRRDPGATGPDKTWGDLAPPRQSRYRFVAGKLLKNPPEPLRRALTNQRTSPATQPA